MSAWHQCAPRVRSRSAWPGCVLRVHAPRALRARKACPERVPRVHASSDPRAFTRYGFPKPDIALPHSPGHLVAHVVHQRMEVIFNVHEPATRCWRPI